VKSPIKSRLLLPIVKPAIAATPNISTKEIILLLQPYVIDIFLTYALITKVRNTVRDIVFGDPDTNVQCLPAFIDSVDASGHACEVFAKSPLMVRKRLLAIVLQEKMSLLKKEQKVMAKQEKLKYVAAWEKANRVMLDDVGLGPSVEEQMSTDKFVTGIFLSISAAKKTVPLLSPVYQADAAHTKFGKYTLYSCYGITANCNAFPVAFGIVFGNEDKEGWEKFWHFTKNQHPCLDHPRITVITDQQKDPLKQWWRRFPRLLTSFAATIGGLIY